MKLAVNRREPQLIGGVDSDTRKASMACDYKVCSSHWEQVQFLPNQINEKTTRLPLPEDRRSAVEWGHEAPLFISLERIQQC